MGELRAELRRRMEALRRKRDGLIRDLESLDKKIASYGEAMAAGRLPGGPRKRPRNTMVLLDALKKLLANKTLSVTEAAEAVQKAGYMTTSPNFRVIVNQTLLSNKNSFRKVSRGRYTARK